ncbi:alanine/arginine aminopeptidase [[Candida] jaroonii]|uniref:Alanine/arginine aminopeptidase n=1 Tax=[Candida] jaroonii TaxID=467808 RepID=A0ACA9Y1A1_9ASCO|nr:alanine/arginine aminopeptidase [[Candida] jaroonii]
MASESPYYDALPSDLSPFHYDVSIYDIDVAQDTFAGKVKIHLKVNQSTDEVCLNYRDLTFKNSDVVIEVDDGSKISVEKLTVVSEKEFIHMKLAEKINGTQATITIDYIAKIQSNMAGFYRSDYMEGDKKKVMLSTQFEAPDARRAFPCFDEPNLKATFSIDLTIINEWTGLSNMPVSKTENLGALKKITFEKTPKMSTYLVAWCCGDLEYVESFTNDLYYDDKPLPIRIYTTKGYSKAASFASEITPKIIDYFSTIFDLKYPLPKLDLIAVHTFSHNAMENWGLVTYRSNALLYDEKTSGPSFIKQVCYVIAHEMAHQWFGNLVTMKWWDELWLNEGFATFVGYIAVEHLKPEWDIFNLVISESQQLSLGLDGLRSSHPIHVPVINAVDIDQLFDGISYHKGCSIISMISNYVGKETFLKGVSNYLKANKFNNATTSDLWNAIADVSGKPIVSMMDNWIRKIGFPLVSVDINDNNLVLTQRRFLSTGDVTPKEDETVWWLPLNISTGPREVNQLTNLSIDAFESKKVIIENFPLSEDFFKLSKNSSGFYRVNYSPSILKNNILPFMENLTAKDKIGLFADVHAIAISGMEPETNTITFLELLKSIVENGNIGEDYAVWADLSELITKLEVAFCFDDEFNQGIRNFTISIYKSIGLKLLEELKANDDQVDESNFLKVNLISIIFHKCGLLAIPEFVDYSKKLFSYWKNGEKSKVHPSLILYVFSTISSLPDLSSDDFDVIAKEITHPTTLDSGEVAVKSLPSTTNPEFMEKLFQYIIDPKIVPVMDSHYMAKSLTLNPSIKHKFWTFFKENYDSFYKNLSVNVAVMERFIRFTFVNYQSQAMVDDFTEFFKSKGVVGFERSYDQVIDNIKTNDNWFKRDGDKVKQWFKENNFIQ